MTGNGGEKVAILTGGFDPHYAVPLIAALTRREFPAALDVVCSDTFLSAPELQHHRVRILNLHGDTGAGKTLYQKVLRVLRTYARLAIYAARTESRLFHILWHNRFEVVDRVLLTLYYKMLGKKLVHTAHNVDRNERDGKRSRMGRTSLRLMYRLMDHIFVHTEPMREQLVGEFGIDPSRVTVIPFGMNTVTPLSNMTRTEARKRLGFDDADRVVLFFGNIAPYKGIEYLVQAAAILRDSGLKNLKVVIAGNVKDGTGSYWTDILASIEARGLRDCVRPDVRFVPEDEVEVFFKGSDVCVLPYRYICQTGLLCLSHRYGLPVVATDVGNMKSEIIEGRTGFVCRPSDPEDLAAALRRYFESQLFAQPEQTRRDVAAVADRQYSWEPIAATITNVYKEALTKISSLGERLEVESHD